MERKKLMLIKKRLQILQECNIMKSERKKLMNILII